MKTTLLFTVLALQLSLTYAQSEINFSQRSIDENFKGVSTICTNDINGDGLKDLVMGSEATSQTSPSIGLWWQKNNGDGTWTKIAIDENFNNVMSIEVNDINNDGHYDILASAWNSHEIAYWLNSGGTNPTFSKRSVVTNYNYAHDAHSVDMNGDSLVDIIGLSAYYGTVNIWYQQENGTFIEQEVDNTLAGDRGLSIADYNSDGNLDIAVVAAPVKQLAIFYASNSNPIVWTKQIVTSAIDGAHEVVSVDFDDDGDIDLLTSAYASNSIDIWKNDGQNPVNWTRVNVGTHIGVNRALAADFDKDGDLDIVATGKYPTSKLSVWENLGGEPNTFSEIVINDELEAFWALEIDDFDDDGDIDILAGASVSGVARWWENKYTPTTTATFQNNNSRFQGMSIFPNPAISHFSVSFELKSTERVQLAVYSITGELVENLEDEPSNPGLYSKTFDANRLKSGMYICRLMAGQYHYAQKFIIFR